jgi:hypothetical protein
MSIGRPTKFSPELTEKICTQLASGKSLREICEHEEMPAKSTILRWLFEEDKKDFQDQYARAREIQAELLADELCLISDDGHNDWMEKHYGDNTQWVENREAIARSRLRIDTRKWIAAKLLPKKYGEKTETTLKGDPNAPIVISKTAEGW